MSTPEPLPAAVDRARATNSIAIVSFVVAFLGICGAAIGAILAIISLRTIKRTGERGRGFAIAGLWISSAWFAVTGVLLAIAFATGFFSDQGVPVNTLNTGACVESIDENISVVRDVVAVPCSQGHEGEIVGTFNPDGEVYPGANELEAVAESVCDELFEHYTSEASRSRADGLYLLIPSESQWRAGNRRIVCMAGFDAPQHGSIRG